MNARKDARTELTFEQWETHYRPIANPVDPNAAVDGWMFETFGPEEEFVRARVASQPGTVWTIVEGDGEAAQGSDECDEPCAPNWFVVDGYHIVNRVGYLITEKPFAVTQNAPHLCIAY